MSPTVTSTDTDTLSLVDLFFEYTPALAVLPPGTDIPARKAKHHQDYLDRVERWHGASSATYRAAVEHAKVWWS